MLVLLDLDLGLPVSISTILGVSSSNELGIWVSNDDDDESLLLWIDVVCSLLVSSNLSCKSTLHATFFKPCYLFIQIFKTMDG